MIRIGLPAFALLCGAAIAAPAASPPPATAAALQTARVARTTDLREAPASDSALIRVVPANSEVAVAERQGGWYKVEVEDAPGWMRLSAVRFANSAGGTAASGVSPLRFLQSGRSAVTTGAVTTGVRGLSEEGLSRATPDYVAVSNLDPLAVPADEARKFAQEGQLVASSLAYVAPPKAEKKDKKSRKRDGGGAP